MKTSLRLVATLILALFTASTATVQAEDYLYETNNGTITITGYTGSGGAVTIPDKINGLPVTSIGDFTFSWCTNLTGVTIPSCVTSMWMQAFWGCTSLTAITVDRLNGSFSSLDGVLFNKYETTLITYPRGKAGDYSIPNSVTNIEYGAFADCTSLTAVTIPQALISIGDSAFSRCDKLTAITVNALNSRYASVEGVLLDKSQTTLIRYPGGKPGSYTIPDSVTSIGDWAFSSSSSLTDITIPNSVTNIGAGAFADCQSVAHATLGNSVTRIGYEAFRSCTRLISVTIPKTVTSISARAFWGCTTLTEIVVDALNAEYSSVDGVLFEKSQTLLLRCPGGRTGDYTIPSSVTIIGGEAFRYCTELKSITIPGSVTNIQRQFAFCLGASFGGCTNLIAITVDESNPSYSSRDGVLFNKNQTTLINYPGGKVGSYTIPDSVTSIEDYAFSHYIYDDWYLWKTGVGMGLTGITIPRSVTYIGDNAFCGCTALTSVTIPDSLTSIGSWAFEWCTNLSSVTIPNSVIAIGWGAFRECTSLTSVTIPNSVTYIGEYAFERCTSLTAVRCEGSAPTLLSGVFDATPAMVYYLPGTAGWGSTFGGRPTALWQPVVQSDDASFGVRTNKFGFTITWATGKDVVVEASPALVNPTWLPVSTNTLTDGWSYFSDPEWTNHPMRFYRIRSP